MSSLELGDTVLGAEHRRVLGWLRRSPDAPRAHEPARIDTSQMSRSTLGAARWVWSQRMVNEHSSAAVFTRLVPQLMRCGAPLEFLTSATRAAADELHHGALCGDVVRALGGTAPKPASIATRPLPEHPGCSDLECTFRNMLFVGCLAETVAVAFTTEEREQTTDPFVLRVITQISADEVLHARIGWAFVQRFAGELSDAERAATSEWLRLAFRYLEREEMAEVPNVAPPGRDLLEEGMAVGVCDNLATRELFYETVQGVILPGLEAAGLSAKEAWRTRRAA